jgi:hypothetical protein
MSGLLLVTAEGEQHGLIKTLANSVQHDGFKHMKPEIKAKAEKEKKDDSRMVKVRYLNTRGRHERLSKPYCRWAGDPIQFWHFIPGKEYTVPYGLVKEVNSVKIVIREGRCDEEGENPSKKDEVDEPLHRFISTEF